VPISNVEALQRKTAPTVLVVLCSLLPSVDYKVSLHVDQLLADKEIALDFIEISGGCYEESVMMSGPSSRSREAYFMDFAEKVRALVILRNNGTNQASTEGVGVAFMLTGGFRSATVMNDCLKRGVVDIVGLGRPFIMQPDRIRQLISFSSLAALGKNTEPFNAFVFKDAHLKTGVKDFDAGSYHEQILVCSVNFSMYCMKACRTFGIRTK
jgi:hypothetical protein